MTTIFDKVLCCSMCGKFLCHIKNDSIKDIEAVCNNCKIYLVRRQRKIIRKANL